MLDKSLALRMNDNPIRDICCGLTETEASRRLAASGMNKLTEEKKKSVISSFFRQLNDPLVLILTVAMAVSVFLGELADAAIILMVVVANAFVGMLQEKKAEHALEALKKMETKTALVIRDAVEKEVDAKTLVEGDLVCLDAGRMVPADLKLVECCNLMTDESALTGESVPVIKQPVRQMTHEENEKNDVYMTTTITRGRGKGIVMRTGMNTKIGRVAGLISNLKPETTPLAKQLTSLGKLLSLIALILCVLLYILAVLQRRDIGEMLITAISLAVAAVPEGLASVVTIVLATGVQKMARANTIVRRLPAVETLGAVNVVCSDKTGTLTQNRMHVCKCYFGRKDRRIEDAILYPEMAEGFTLCNDAVLSESQEIGDPTETALLRFGRLNGVDKSRIDMDYMRVNEIPFDSENRCMTTIHKRNGRYRAYTKGATDVILKFCDYYLFNQEIYPMNAYVVKEIEQACENYAKDALRVLALAMKDMPHDDNRESRDHLIFIGLTAMSDPPRPGVKECVESFRKAGVSTTMITGDHKNTAVAIAKELDIIKDDRECITGSELDNMSPEELSRKILDYHVFARVSPEHKVRIVSAYKKQGKITAMTGDGVNDAPSLKAADVGIAMGQNGTDVAKNAADMILTDDNFTTIEKAVAEGRGIYENIRKSVLFLLSSNFGEIITMFFAVALGLPVPLRAGHILWVNLITDSLPALALGTDRNKKEYLMSRPPRNRKKGILAVSGMMLTLCYGFVIAAVSIIAFLRIPISILWKTNCPIDIDGVRTVLENTQIQRLSQTRAFVVLSISQLAHAVGMRAPLRSIFRMNHLANPLMILAIIIGLVLQIAVVMIPSLTTIFLTSRMQVEEVVELVLLSMTPLVVHECICLGQWIQRIKKK